MEKIWLWKFFVVVSLFFICIHPSAACAAQEAQPFLAAGSAVRGVKSNDECFFFFFFKSFVFGW